ncbi:MAG: hypothetical protein LQ343_007858, partial [Gyalolechia ehrenbergii]
MTLPRSDKGAVLRKEVYKSFKKDILDVYQELKTNVTAPPIDLTSPVSSIKCLIMPNLPLSVVRGGMVRKQRSVQAWDGRSPSDKVTQIELELPTMISQDSVYRHPSAAELPRPSWMDYLRRAK